MTTWLQISSGEGPAECEWAVARLRDVIVAEARAAGLEVRVLEEVAGEQAGICKTVLLALEGEQVAGFVAGWQGTVQWIGRSPYRPQHKRKNWFVGVESFQPPEVPSWSTEELEFQTMRSSGPGGQNVNKVETAVRIIHLPTGLTVVAREERSQQQNRRLGLARLARLFAQREQAARGGLRNQRWQQHHALVRGNAVRVFEGPDFEPRIR